MTPKTTPFHRLAFVTPRLNVDHWVTRLDVPEARARMASILQELLTPEVTKHLPLYLHVDGSLEQAERAMRDLAAKSEVACVVDRASQAVAGLLVVGQDAQEANAVYIGYLFDQAFWRRGLATELLHGLVTWAQAQGWQGRMLGGVDPENAASAAVLRKAGFTEDAARSGPDTVMYGRVFGHFGTLSTRL